LAQFWLTNDSSNGTRDTIDIPGWDSALADAEKAIALAPGLAAGYAARGFVRAIYRFDFAGGQVDLDKAVALSPRDADVLHRSAVLLGILGKLPAAIAREEQARAARLWSSLNDRRPRDSRVPARLGHNAGCRKAIVAWGARAER